MYIMMQPLCIETTHKLNNVINSLWRRRLCDVYDKFEECLLFSEMLFNLGGDDHSLAEQ